VMHVFESLDKWIILREVLQQGMTLECAEKRCLGIIKVSLLREQFQPNPVGVWPKTAYYNRHDQHG
jgi:hypothetical protein